MGRPRGGKVSSSSDATSKVDDKSKAIVRTSGRERKELMASYVEDSGSNSEKEEKEEEEVVSNFEESLSESISEPESSGSEYGVKKKKGVKKGKSVTPKKGGRGRKAAASPKGRGRKPAAAAKKSPAKGRPGRKPSKPVSTPTKTRPTRGQPNKRMKYRERSDSEEEDSPELSEESEVEEIMSESEVEEVESGSDPEQGKGRKRKAPQEKPKGRPSAKASAPSASAKNGRGSKAKGGSGSNKSDEEDIDMGEDLEDEEEDFDRQRADKAKKGKESKSEVQSKDKDKKKDASKEANGESDQSDEEEEEDEDDKPLKVVPKAKSSKQSQEKPSKAAEEKESAKKDSKGQSQGEGSKSKKDNEDDEEDEDDDGGSVGDGEDSVKSSKSSKSEKSEEASLKNPTDTDYKSLSFECNQKTKDGDAPNFRISSWNIGGLKSWIKKNGLEYLKKENPDVMCLQEIKSSEKTQPNEVKSIENYPHTYWSFSETAGHHGVGILSKVKPENVTYGLPIKDGDSDEDKTVKEGFNKEGRLLVAEFDKFILINAYVPNGGRAVKDASGGKPYPPRVTNGDRGRWDKLFRDYVKELDAKKPVVLTGDLNCAHEEIDLANPKTNTCTAGFTKEEREGFGLLLKETGMVDSFRELYGDEKGHYTFWSYMHNSRAKNVGWRLDYFLISKKLLDSLVDNTMRNKVLGSDHCPITLFLHLE